MCCINVRVKYFNRGVVVEKRILCLRTSVTESYSRKGFCDL